ncbi:hypothetical protein PUNSTDRAFT_60896 [Punctularia strigosozonata HHB-11173 SS5]|uniref:uncharacterized protein n=1 Tax=Punctularia strigosozonata (strain HHB-11173) TaxID=741275 RepID=UPI0004418370|nr:uncharacterized protein PUNSTDRAFT_60896 [Punctularia strigosozonata HHB-11173 SS5]EIN12607.1 hypothetical protein PUNSTDRAFT_60896 [Punctularia strigosozonata HHB-11173 SS5]
MGYPLGVLPNYTRHPTELALKIKEKRLSWSGDDFTIRDAMTETPIFRVNGKTFTWHGRQQLVDAQGAPLMDISFEPMHFVHSVFNGHDPVTKERLFRIRSKVSFGANLIITFQNKCGPYAGREMELSLKGDFFAREATIQYDGAVIARIDRKFWNSRQFIFDQQSYILTVGPGVDIAFMVALCLCLDQLRDDGGAPANGVGAVIDLAL